MVLRMARPITRKGTDNPAYRKRIPEDVKRILDKLPASYRPTGWGKNEIVISLRTADKRKAAAEYARIASEVETRFTTLRTGVKTLSRKEAVALSGTIYRAYAESLEDNPGSAEKWTRLLTGNLIAKAGKFGMGPLLIDKEAKRQASMESHFGPIVDAVLSREGLLIDDDSRKLLVEEVAKATDQAFLKLRRNAESDYSPDEEANRFPAWINPASKAGTSEKKLTLLDVFERWEKHPEQAAQARRTVSRYRGVFASVSAFLKNPDAHIITTEDIRSYLEARMAAGLSPRSANDVDKAALNSILNWALGKGIVATNPVADCKIKVTKTPILRPKGLTDSEAHALTKACLAIPTSAPQGTMEAAQRWIPLICLFTGARRGEVAQLRKADIKRNPLLHFHFTPDAGTMKDKEFRNVPVHSRLIELGFLSFIDSANDGPLFYDPANRRNGKATTPQSELVGSKVVAWLKGGPLNEKNLKNPLHAIRHRFSTCARRAGIEEQYVEAIDGHSSGRQGRAYGEYHLSVLQREIERLKAGAIEGSA